MRNLFASTRHIPGGLSEGMTLRDIAARHRLPLSTLVVELRKGTRVEMEHTSSRAIAQEIAMDHLFEDPHYYVKLSQMERARPVPNEVPLRPARGARGKR